MKVKEKRFDVLCQCGFGRLGVRFEDVPAQCPVCGFDFEQHAMDLAVENGEVSDEEYHEDR